MQNTPSRKTVLLIGASRGLGFAMVKEYLKRGYRVIATGRAASTVKLRRLADTSAGDYEVYRGSKAALDMFMRTFAARSAEYPRNLLLMAPG